MDIDNTVISPGYALIVFDIPISELLFMMEPIDYKYTPIDEATGEIRVLILLPARFKDPVEGLLLSTPFTNVPEYEAVSYAWGSTDDPIPISIRTTDMPEARALLANTFNSIHYRTSRWKQHGRKKIEKLYQKFEGLSLVGTSLSSQGFARVSVTRNLGRALPYLRYTDRPRVLWIDAICVNQNDLIERSKQVQRMANVFTQATRVVVWLGEESHNSKHAMENLKMVSTKINYDFENRRLLLASEDPTDAHVRIERFFLSLPIILHYVAALNMFSRCNFVNCSLLATIVCELANSDFSTMKWADHNANIPLNADTMVSLRDILCRPWFERLWIWQEIQLANQSSILICGKDVIQWPDFCKAVWCLLYKPDSVPHENELEDLNERIERAATLCDNHAGNPFGVLQQATKHSKCTDPRDRIFALLSLVHKHERQGIQPRFHEDDRRSISADCNTDP